MNAILESNSALQGLPEVRLRSTWQVTGHPRSTPWSPYGVHLILWAHPKGVWGPGACDMIPQADRVDPRAAIVVQTNTVHSTLTQQNSAVRDEQIEAFIQPEQIGKVGKYPVYRGQTIVLTFDGRLPWVPLTSALGNILDLEYNMAGGRDLVFPRTVKEVNLDLRVAVRFCVLR